MFNLFKKKKANKPVKDEAYYRSYDAYEEEEDIYFEKRNNQKARVFLVMGPTCSGKTKVSIEIAKKFNAEIINADKEQMYKHLNIGTAKVTKEEMKGIKHHLIDFLDLRSNYTVRDYQRDGRKILDELLDQGKNVVVVGGSGLYIKALLFDYRFPEEDPEFYPECENFGNGYLKMNNLSLLLKCTLIIDVDLKEYLLVYLHLKSEFIITVVKIFLYMILTM